MGIFKKIATAGIAKKVYDEARKPENQRKIQNVVASAKAKRAGSRSRRTS